MNDITLNASNEMYLKIADCFRGCEVVFAKELPNTVLVGLSASNKDKFLIENKHNIWLISRITLDLDTCQPCIYACMKHGLRVEVELNYRGVIKRIPFDLSFKPEVVELIEHLGNIKSIKLLDMEEEG
tara:strand:- start:183 stop:566 length:384 start_codon:yes stop_codon:yes gene_type:complete